MFARNNGNKLQFCSPAVKTLQVALFLPLKIVLWGRCMLNVKKSLGGFGQSRFREESSRGDHHLAGRRLMYSSIVSVYKCINKRRICIDAWSMFLELTIPNSPIWIPTQSGRGGGVYWQTDRLLLDDYTRLLGDHPAPAGLKFSFCTEGLKSE